MSGVILVTGASTGLGLSISLQAAQAGHRVYASKRNLAKRSALEAVCKAAGVVAGVLAMNTHRPCDNS
jgi:NAD(P)-dependent dehydrogenase (short-subunit alcohol dehydrogenase family)